MARPLRASVGLLLAAGLLTVAGTSALAHDPPLWVRHLEAAPYSDYAEGVAMDDVGNVLVVGSSFNALGESPAGGEDAWMAKYDPAGHLLWLNQYGSSENDVAKGVAIGRDGGIATAGCTGGGLDGPNAGLYDAWVARADGDGNPLWIRQLGTSWFECARGVAMDGDGNVLVAGETEGSLAGPNRGGWDGWVAKYDADGQRQWKQQIGTSAEYEGATGVAADPMGNVVVVGDIQGSAWATPPSDAWVKKYDAAGGLLWARRLGSADFDYAKGVATDGAGNILVAGETAGALDGPNRGGGGDAWLAKYDSEGTLVWIRQLDTTEYDTAQSVAVDGRGDVAVAGGTAGSLVRPNPRGGAAWVAKYDADGRRLWMRQLRSRFPGSVDGVAMDDDGDVAIAGTLVQGSGRNVDLKAFVAKYPSD